MLEYNGVGGDKALVIGATGGGLYYVQMSVCFGEFGGEYYWQPMQLRLSINGMASNQILAAVSENSFFPHGVQAAGLAALSSGNVCAPEISIPASGRGPVTCAYFLMTLRRFSE